MANYAQRALELIEAQQEKLSPRSAAWMVGQQLKDICREEPVSAELIAQDMEDPAMGIVAAEKRIKAFSDEQKTGNFFCVAPQEADKILRKFYGLPNAGAVNPPRKSGERTQGSGMNLDLEALLE